jgi:hypothetical protein
MPNRDHPDNRSMDTIKEAVRQHNNLSMGQVRELWDNAA